MNMNDDPPDEIKIKYEEALQGIINECVWGEHGRFAILLVGDPRSSFVNVLSINSDREQALMLLALASDAMITQPKNNGALN